LSAKPASLVFSVAMFYHLPDPVGFARDVANCLADDGVWVIQMAYLPAMMATNMYDNIVHEHVGYYATCHLQAVMALAGLEIFDVELNDVYGGSFRAFVKRAGAPGFPATDRYRRTLDDERDARLKDVGTYLAFSARVARTRDDLRALCSRLRAEGRLLWVYGASTKGNTILQYCGLGAADFAAAADPSPFKIGKYLVGSDVPIRSEADMRAARPDLLLALPYSFVPAFIERERALVDAGTRFIVPLPDVAIRP
jgi:NDP-4-keto-2,6-dideoxyhexose 3-C-methyltransferase